MKRGEGFQCSYSEVKIRMMMMMMMMMTNRKLAYAHTVSLKKGELIEKKRMAGVGEASGRRQMCKKREKGRMKEVQGAMRTKNKDMRSERVWRREERKAFEPVSNAAYACAFLSEY